MEKLMELFKAEWHFVSENKLGCKVSTMDTHDAGGVRSVRGDCLIPYNAKDLFFMVTD